MPINDLKYTLSLKDLFSKKMAGAIDATSRLDSKMSKLDSKMSSLSSGIVGAFSVGAVAAFGRSVIDSLKNYEYFSASLRVLMHGDSKAASALNGQLMELAKVTPFSLVDVQDSAKKLLAYGFAANDVIRQMKMLGDISAATGNQIGDVAYLYGTLRTQGKAMTKDLYQFTNRGINVIPQLAKKFGILESQVYKFAEQGKISFRDIESAFEEMTKEGGDFFGMMAEQSKTVGGQLSNMGDAWEQLKVNIGKSQTGIIASTVNFTNQMISAVSKYFAHMNMEAENFNKYGAISFSWWEKTLATINSALTGNMMGSRVKEQADFQNSLQSSYVNPGTASDATLGKQLEMKSKLSNLLANQYVAYGKKEIDIGELTRKTATIRGALDQIEGAINLNKTSPLKAGALQEEGEATGSLSGLGSKSSISTGGTEISGTKPQSLVINITKLVESLNINTTNLKDSASKIKEEVSKALLEAVNDVNLIAR